MEKIMPCINLAGKCEEAAEFYCSIFKDAQVVSRCSSILLISISGFEIVLHNSIEQQPLSPAISFYYSCEDINELNTIWNALYPGCTVILPLKDYHWSKQYGWITDKFGVSWQICLGNMDVLGEKITPFLTFGGTQQGNGERALNFYSTLLKPSKIDGVLVDKHAKRVQHAQFALGPQKFILIDSEGDFKPNFSDGASFIIHCKYQSEIDHYWEKLSKEGQVSQAGKVKDQFGITWYVIPSILGELIKDPVSGGKVFESFKLMTKSDINQLIEISEQYGESSLH